MFLPGRMAFVYDLDEEFSHDIPTTLHRSKADCPAAQEMVTVGVDGSVLERIAKIMTYLRLGSSGKILKKKKKDSTRENKVKGPSTLPSEDDKNREVESINGMSRKLDHGSLPPPPPVKKAAPRTEDDDIFQGAGVDYVPITNDAESPILEDMEESPREMQRPSYFVEQGYGPAPPPETTHEWQQQVGYDSLQGPLLSSSYQGEWQEYPAAPPETYAGPWLPDQLPYPLYMFVYCFHCRPPHSSP